MFSAIATMSVFELPTTTIFALIDSLILCVSGGSLACGAPVLSSETAPAGASLAFCRGVV